MSLPRALLVLGYVLHLIAGLRVLTDHETAVDGKLWVWLAAYLVLGVAFTLGATARATDRPRRLGALSVMVPAMLTMAALKPCQFGALSLVLVASQAALVVRPRTAILVVATSTAALFFLTRNACDTLSEHVAWMIAFLGFQGFATVTVFLARREAESKQALALSNAELRATRALLEESSRASERTRIARELHDVLGHDLTALGLQLEVATHVAPAEARAHVTRAQDVSARLLRNVREVVRETSRATGPEITRALRELVRDTPRLRVHLDMPDRLDVDDPARAHCVLRCVQEVVTNTLRHAQADNLWITIQQREDAITVDARDDGRGARDEELLAGHGLSGMRARLEEMGGWLRVVAAPQRALELTARLPLRGQGS